MHKKYINKIKSRKKFGGGGRFTNNNPPIIRYSRKFEKKFPVWRGHHGNYGAHMAMDRLAAYATTALPLSAAASLQTAAAYAKALDETLGQVRGMKFAQLNMLLFSIRSAFTATATTYRCYPSVSSKPRQTLRQCTWSKTLSSSRHVFRQK